MQTSKEELLQRIAQLKKTYDVFKKDMEEAYRELDTIVEEIQNEVKNN